MRIILSATALFFYLHSTSQVINKAKAYENTYMGFNQPLYGTTSNNHTYYVCFVNHYDTTGGQQQTIEVVRVDLNTASVTSKRINAKTSSSALWVWAMDFNGNVWMGLNSNNRSIWKFNFKDSIYAKDYGNGFPDGQALAYSISVGQDGHMMFGASSGGTFWSEYDPIGDSLVPHAEIINAQNYVLNIMGTNDWVYVQVGQVNTNDFFAVRKSDGYKKKLFSCPTNTRFDCKNRNDGFAYVGNPVTGRKYRLNGEDTTFVTAYGGTNTIDRYEVNQTGQVKVTSQFFNKVTSTWSYVTNTGLNNSVVIPTENVETNVQYIFTNPRDTTKVYYFAELYGPLYMYDRVLDTAVAIGLTGYNIKSALFMNDSMVGMASYPSGEFCVWNTRQPWTAGKFDSITQNVIPLNSTSNPKHLTFIRSNTPAEIHEPVGMYFDSSQNIMVFSGNVIRVATTTSIASYNFNTNQAKGYAYQNMPNIQYRSLIQYGRYAILSTTGNSNAKIYIYDPLNNVMVDSIQKAGFTNYGKIYPVGCCLLGIANNRYYKINTAKGNLLYYDSTVAGVTNYFHTMLPDARILINGWVAPPSNFWQFYYIGNDGLMTNYTGSLGSYFTYSGKNIIQTKNMTLTPVNLATAIGKEQFVKRLRNN